MYHMNFCGIFFYINQVGIGKTGVQGRTEKHLQHTDGQSFTGVSQFRWEYIVCLGEPCLQI